MKMWFEHLVRTVLKVYHITGAVSLVTLRNRFRCTVSDRHGLVLLGGGCLTLNVQCKEQIFKE
jgi:hypothetical protein